MKLEKQAQKEINQKLKENLETIKNFQSANDVNNWYFYRTMLTNKEYQEMQAGNLSITQVKKLLKEHLKNYYDKQLKQALKELAKIKSLEKSNFLWGECDIEWIKNRTWGNCPRGEYRNGHDYKEYRSITGCGYCKLSTLTANMLNDDKFLIRYLIDFIEKKGINKENIENKLGYGIRIYHGMPQFSGGVGLECHIRILKNAGLVVQHIDMKKADRLEFSSDKKFFQKRGY